MFNSTRFDNSRGDGFPVLEIATPATQARQFVPLQRSEVRGVVTGPVAELTLTQVFGFSAEQSTAVVEALYRFPLPGDATVQGVEVHFGEVTITAELKPRAEAEAEYAAAKEAGKQAALATRGGADTFTLRVAGIQPDQPVTVVTRFVQLAQADSPGWSLRVPLTLAPRYIRQDESHGGAPQQTPLGLLRDPGHRALIDLTIVGAEGVASPTHEIALTPGAEGVRAQLAAGEVIPDRDLVLRWSVPQAEARPTLHGLAHDDLASGHLYFLAQVAPPRGDVAPLRREVTLLVDHSGSMTGPKWEAADWAAEKLLRSLTPQDAFALGVFHNKATWFAPQLQPGDAATVDQAVAWFKGQRDSGGTDLGVALEQALRFDKGTGEAARSLLVITDGQVTDHSRLFQLAGREFASAQRRRISVLCIDSAPNDFLARQLAERGGGSARFLTSNPDEEDITTALDAILADWAAPALVGLRMVVDRNQAHAVQHRIVPAAQADEAAVDLGDLPAGRVVWVAGRVPRQERTVLALRLELPDGTQAAATTVAAGHYPALAALFAAHRINELEYLAHAHTLKPEEVARRLHDLGFPADALAGVQPTTPSVMYVENMKTPWQEALARLIQAESLASQIPSSETAFVAVRQESGQKVTQVVAVANALPEGWSETFVGGGPRLMSAPGAPGLGMTTFPALSQPLGGQGLQMYGGPRARAMSRPPTPAGSIGSTGSTVGGGAQLYRGTLRDLIQRRVLLDTDERRDALPLPVTLSAVTWTGDAAQRAQAGLGDLVLAIYVGDMAVPRASVRLRDLAAAGRRPLNLRCRAGERVRVQVEGAAGALPADAGGVVEMRLAW